MADVLQAGVAWLLGKLQASVAQTITYSRGVNSVTLTATLGRKLLRVNDGAGNTRTDITDADFLIEAAKLILGGIRTHPERGDRIVISLPDADCTYEVLPYGDEPPFRWSDPFRTIFRVHGKLIEETLIVPAVLSLSPSAGVTAGGTAVTITGLDFLSGATVTFGGLAATSVVVVSATTITCVTPAHASGTVGVVVTNPDGEQGTLAGGYCFGSGVDLWNLEGNVWNTAAFNWATATVTTPVPKTITSATLVQWLDANSGTWQTGTPAAGGNSFSTPAVANNDPVGGWYDLADRGHGVLQATAARKPKLILGASASGLNVVRFDGVDDFLRGGGDQSQWIGAVTQPATVFLRVKCASTGNLRLFSQATGGGANTWLFRVNGGAWDFQSGGNDLSGGTADTSWHTITITLTGGAGSTIRVDGTQVASANVGSGSQSTGFTLSGNENTPVSLDMPMDLAAFLVYQGSLSVADRNTLETYLGTR